jgi:hypothetical protein
MSHFLSAIFFLQNKFNYLNIKYQIKNPAQNEINHIAQYQNFLQN